MSPGPPHTRPVSDSSKENTELFSLPACLVQQFMSLIALLTATEKQVHLDLAIWDLFNGISIKDSWRVPESLGKVITIPKSLHTQFNAMQIFTDSSKEGWGTHLKRAYRKGTWFLPERRLHINYIELIAVFLAQKEFQDRCSDKIILVATDNTTVVSYINKEGGLKSGSLYALLWAILTWCSRKPVTQSPIHSRADECGSRQAIQARPDHPKKWSLLPEVFQSVCSRWHPPLIDLFATGFNKKLPLFVSLVPDPLG